MMIRLFFKVKQLLVVCGCGCAATVSLLGCSSHVNASSAVAAGGATNTFASPGTGTSIGGSGASVGSVSTGGVTSTTSASTIGGQQVTVGVGGAAQLASKLVVAIAQSPKAKAVDLSATDVAELVASAIADAGGLEFIKDGQTVVIKPKLLTVYEDAGEHTASSTVNGINTDWRVVKALVDLVRARNRSGNVLVMEGSTLPTAMAYAIFGYSVDNFGSSVNDFVALEGASCDDRSTLELVERVARSGKTYWVNRRYASADVVISVPTLTTDAWAGIGGAVENLGVGATPAGQYASGTNSIDCTRTRIDRSSPESTSEFIRDYYGIRPADFVVVDGLQGLEHGPLPAWDSSGSYDYASSLQNMRLILAGRNAIAVDSVAAMVMKCDPQLVPYLNQLTSDGLGTADVNQITVVGRPVREVAKAFASRQSAICPGK